MQQEIGSSAFFLNKPFSLYIPICSRSWIKYLWEFLEYLDGKIDFTDACLPPRPFQNDVNLIEFVAAQDVDPHILYALNVCRHHKLVYYILDILETYGTRIRPHAMDIHHRKYQDEKISLIKLPPRDTSFS